jgi:hypothetical protein
LFGAALLLRWKEETPDLLQVEGSGLLGSIEETMASQADLFFVMEAFAFH